MVDVTNTGRITVRHQGGGYKRRYRLRTLSAVQAGSYG